MIFRAFFLLTGFGIAVSGGISIIAYLNMLASGHSLQEYLEFIIRRPECYLFPGGVIIIALSIYGFGNGPEKGMD